MDLFHHFNFLNACSMILESFIKKIRLIPTSTSKVNYERTKVTFGWAYVMKTIWFISSNASWIPAGWSWYSAKTIIALSSWSSWSSNFCRTTSKFYNTESCDLTTGLRVLLGKYLDYWRKISLKSKAFSFKLQMSSLLLASIRAIPPSMWVAKLGQNITISLLLDFGIFKSPIFYLIDCY